MARASKHKVRDSMPGTEDVIEPGYNPAAPKRPERNKSIVRTLYLMQRVALPGKDYVVAVFPNKYRLRKWLAVAETIMPGITESSYVIRSREYVTRDIVDGASRATSHDGAGTRGNGDGAGAPRPSDSGAA